MRLPAPVPDNDRTGLRVERRGLHTLGEAEIAAWRALARRALEPSPLADPDFVLPVAQHLAGPREVSVVLAWDTPARGRPATLRGALPVPRPLGLLARLTAPRRPFAVLSVPLVDADHAPAALAGLLHAISAGPRPVPSLDLADVAPDGRLAASLREAAALLGLAPVRVPAPPTPRAGAVPPGEVTRLRTLPAVREGVELFLALEARTGGACLLDDPPAATAFRVVTRHFARRGQCRVTLARHEGALVGAAVSLRLGERTMLWRSAGQGAAEGIAPRAGLGPDRRAA